MCGDDTKNQVVKLQESVTVKSHTVNFESQSDIELHSATKLMDTMILKLTFMIKILLKKEGQNHDFQNK